MASDTGLESLIDCRRSVGDMKEMLRKCEARNGLDTRKSMIRVRLSYGSDIANMGWDLGKRIVTETISVITNDGRNIVGVLRGFDQATNLILDESHERVYSTKAGVEQLVLGLYIIRGDNIGVVGELDEELDCNLDLSSLRADPLKPVVH